MPRKSTIPPQKRVTADMPVVGKFDVSDEARAAELKKTPLPSPATDTAALEKKIDGLCERIDTLVALVREERAADRKRISDLEQGHNDHESRIRALEERSKGQ